MKNQRFLAPLISIGIGITLLIVAIFNLNQPTSSMFDSTSASYFIKPIEINHLYVVEPNMEGYMSENVDPPNLEEVVYSSLNELDQRYAIDKTEIVNIERKGVTIPNLYVYVHPDNLDADTEQSAGRSASQSAGSEISRSRSGMNRS